MEIEGIVRRTGSLFRDKQYHYLHPSGAHAEAFLRLADALHDPTEVLRIADWIAPYLSPNIAVVGDTGALISLLATLDADARSRWGRELQYRTLTEYADSPEQIEFVLDDLLSRVRPARVVFLVSVSSSGRLVDHILKVAPHDTNVIVIVDTGNLQNYPRVERLAHVPIRQFPMGSNGKCEDCTRRPLLGIDRRTYERIPDLTLERSTFDRKLVSEHREFWEVVEKENAVKLHFDIEANDGSIRHHGVYLEIGKLLNNAWFRERTIQTLRNLRRPELVLVPAHRTTTAVLDLVRGVFPVVRACVVPAARFTDEISRELRAVPKSGSILIADDGLVEGSTLIGFRHEFYRVTQSGGAPALQAFVCVARPESQDVITNTTRPFRDASGIQLHAAYTVLLPGCGEERCPWCIEASVLARAIQRADAKEREILAGRQMLLASRDLNPPFLYGTNDLDLGLKTTGSFIGELGQNPGGHLKFLHLWPGQIPPPRPAGRGDFSRV